MITPKINQINELIASKKYNLATKYTLDVTWNFLRTTVHHNKALQLRLDYNSYKTLGNKNLLPDHEVLIHQQLNELIKQLPSLKETKLEQKNTLQVNKLTKAYNHGSFKFGEIDLDIKQGEITGIVGENGNGKTTFLRLILGELHPNSGTIAYTFPLEKINAPEPYKVKNKVAFIPQRVPKWKGTLKENLSYHAALHGITRTENTQHVQYVLARMGLSTFSELKWAQLSSGYKLRFELAKMLVWYPELLVLDEPLANLDIQATQELLDDLKYFATNPSKPVGIILTSQQLHEVEQISDNIVFLRNGSPVYSGNLTDFAQNREVNTIELQGNFSHEVIRNLFPDDIVDVAPSNTVISLSFKKELAPSTLLKKLLEKGYEIKYFRDITNSTVQLFNQN